MKHKEKTTGLDLEWLFIFTDYYLSLNKIKLIKVIILPFIVSLVCTIIYCTNNLIPTALKHLSELIPTAVSILIGFTAMVITILITTGGKNVEALKAKHIDKKIRKNTITYFQKIYIESVHSLLLEIILLLLVFLYLFIYGMEKNNDVLVIYFIFLLLEVYLIINILISIVNNVTTLYFGFYKN